MEITEQFIPDEREEEGVGDGAGHLGHRLMVVKMEHQVGSLREDLYLDEPLGVAGGRAVGRLREI